jgi:hypothetical protein
MKDLSFFAGRIAGYSTCRACRNKRVPIPVAPSRDAMITLNELDDHYFDLSDDDDEDDDPDDNNNVCFDGHIYLDDSQISNTSKEIIDSIFEKVEQISGYKFASKGVANPRKRFSIAFYGWCAQRTDLNRQVPDDQTRRYCDRMETYDCGGEMKGVLHKDQRWVILTVKHGSSHPRHQEDRRPLTTPEVRNFILANSNNSTSPALYRLVQRTFGPETTRSQVAFWRQRAMESRYRLHDDQFASSKMLVENYGSQGFDQVSFQLVEGGGKRRRESIDDGLGMISFVHSITIGGVISLDWVTWRS